MRLSSACYVGIAHDFLSLDQTTRIHGAVSTGALTKPVWHEISRPQVHGYDVLGATFIDPLKFVSIADEKVARVFEAPRGFVQLAEALGVSEFSDDEVCLSLCFVVHHC